MAIDLTKVGVGVGVGLVDEVLERRDGGKPLFKRTTDWYRLLAVLGGYGAGQFLPRQARMLEDVASAAVPLLTKTVAGAVLSRVGTKDFTAAFSPASRASASDLADTGRGSYRPLQG